VTVGEEGTDKRAPLVGEREGEKGENWPAGLRPRKEGGHRGNWAKQAENKEKGKKLPFYFPNIYIFLKTHFSIEI